VQKYLRGSKGITCATDPVGETLTVRRYESGVVYYSTYVLAAARGDFSQRLAHIKEPATVRAEPGTGAFLAFQGYTVYGQYLYCLSGNQHSGPAKIDSYITCVDLHSGRVIQTRITRAGLSLPNREPEGMGVYRTVSGQHRLFFGLASHPAGNVNRYASLYFKNVLVG